MSDSIEKNWILVYFDSDQTCSILQDSTNKLKNSKSAKVKIGNKWYTGEIKFRGSEKECNSKANKMHLGEPLTTDDEESLLPVDEPKKKTKANRADPLVRDRAKLNDYNNNSASNDLDETLNASEHNSNSYSNIQAEQETNFELNSSFLNHSSNSHSSSASSSSSSLPSSLPDNAVNKVNKFKLLLNNIHLFLLKPKGLNLKSLFQEFFYFFRY